VKVALALSPIVAVPKQVTVLLGSQFRSSIQYSLQGELYPLGHVIANPL